MILLILNTTTRLFRRISICSASLTSCKTSNWKSEDVPERLLPSAIYINLIYFVFALSRKFEQAKWMEKTFLIKILTQILLNYIWNAELVGLSEVWGAPSLWRHEIWSTSGPFLTITLLSHLLRPLRHGRWQIGDFISATMTVLFDEHIQSAFRCH